MKINARLNTPQIIFTSAFVATLLTVVDSFVEWDKPIYTGLFAGIMMNSGMTSFHIEDAPKIAEILREKKIIVSPRKDVIRMAPHFYNTKDELECAITELARLAK